MDSRRLRRITHSSGGLSIGGLESRRIRTGLAHFGGLFWSLRRPVEVAVHGPCRAEHDVGQRRRACTDVDEANAGLQLDWPSRVRHDRNGVRNRRWFRCHGFVYGRLFIHEPWCICMHHPVLDSYW